MAERGIPGSRLEGCGVVAEYPTDRGLLAKTREYLDHYGAQLPGKVVTTPDIGVIFQFDEPTVIWLNDTCEFVVSDYVVIRSWE